MGVDLVAIVPVLGRPERVEPFMQNWLETTTVASALVFVSSPSDLEERIALRLQGAYSIVAEFEPGPGDFAKKTNMAARMSKDVWPESRYIFAGADDLLFHEGWDTAALEMAEKTGKGMIGTQDGGNPLVVRGRHATHSLFSRRYIEEEGASWDGPGTVYSESYDHQYVDAEAVHIAQQRGEWVFCEASYVEHLHVLWGKAPDDATYRKALAHGVSDGALFRARQRLYG